MTHHINYRFISTFDLTLQTLSVPRMCTHTLSLMKNGKFHSENRKFKFFFETAMKCIVQGTLNNL